MKGERGEKIRKAMERREDRNRKKVRAADEAAEKPGSAQITLKGRQLLSNYNFSSK